MVQLYTDVASVLEKAISTFTVLEEPTYASKALGSSHQLETLTCDCSRSGSGDSLCGEDSDCINRHTSIECIGDHLGHDKCLNRRFQDKRYASIDVFDAGKKGFGVRALAPIAEGDLIWEYVGEVVDENRFMKRRRAYETKGIRHFYFMMLQKDEFIDATEKGSIARFCNHSCNPNGFVDKWIVGPKLRMGIFAKRDIVAGEEITFNYNVDRYGADPQPCYCGEPNCIGVLGGKKQTAGLHIPQAVYDALGLDSADEEAWVALVSKLKKKELDETTGGLLPEKPIGNSDDVSKIMTTLMQSRDVWLVNKLVNRVLTSESSSVQGEVLRMHGYEIFGTLLNQWQKEAATTTAMLRILMKWPKLTRNKISSSKIEGVVSQIAHSSDLEQESSELARELLQEWSSLQMAYRIPRLKREKQEVCEVINTGHATSAEVLDSDKAKVQLDAQERPQIQERSKFKLPSGWEARYSTQGQIYYYNAELDQTTWERPYDREYLERERQRERERERQREKENTRLQEEKARQADTLQRIINDAALALTVEPPTPASTDSQQEETPGLNVTKEATPQRNLTKQLAKYVPKLVWRHEGELGHDRCKRYAKEIVQLLVEKELKKGVGDDFDLNDEKKKKIKHFVASFMEKVLSRGQRSGGSGTGSPNKRVGHAPADAAETFKKTKISG